MSDTQTTTDTPTALTWQDCPAKHTTGAAMAIRLRLIAEALDTLGDTEIADTWANLGIQVVGKEDPAGRKAAVDAIGAALGLDPATGGRHDTYQAGVWGLTVYTGKLHQPGCCEHCAVSGS